MDDSSEGLLNQNLQYPFINIKPKLSRAGTEIREMTEQHGSIRINMIITITNNNDFKKLLKNNIINSKGKTYPLQFFLAKLLPISVGRVHDFAPLCRLHLDNLCILYVSNYIL